MHCAIGYDPRIVGDAVGTTPIFNWLLWGYGVPAASFWAGSIFLRRRGDDAPLRMVEAAAILFTALLAFMEIRHVANGGDIYRRSAVAARICAAGLRRARHGDRAGAAAHPQRQHRSQCRRGRAHGHRRPRQRVRPVDPGEPDAVADRCRRRFINLLLLGYALPAVLALLLSYAVAGHRPAAYANTIAAGALVFALPM